MDELEISGKRYISTRLAGKLHKYHPDYIGQLIRGKKIVGQKVGRSWYVDAESLAAYFSNPSPKEEAKPVLSVSPVKQTKTVEVAEEVEVVSQEVVAEETTPTQQEPEKVAEPVQEEKTQESEEEKETESAPVVDAEALQSFRRPLRVDDDEPRKEESKVEEEKFVEQEFETARDSIHIPIRLSAEKKSGGLRYIEDAAPALPEIKKVLGKKAKAVVMPKQEQIPVVTESKDIAPAEQKSFGILVPAFSIVTLGVVAFAVVAISSLMINSTTVIEAGKTASVGYTLR